VKIAARIAHGIAATTFACLALVYRFAPSENSFYPDCLFAKLTGWECPGCGSTRALYALLHLRVTEAMTLNPLFTIGFPLVMVWALAQYVAVIRNGRTFAIRWPKNAVAAALLATFAFGVLRNLPPGGAR